MVRPFCRVCAIPRVRTDRECLQILELGDGVQRSIETTLVECDVELREILKVGETDEVVELEGVTTVGEGM